MKKAIYFLILMVSITCTPSFSQISKPIKRKSIQQKISIPETIKKTMEDIDMAHIEKQDNAKNRFGYAFHVDYNLTKSGKWVDLKNGDRIWFLTIECPKAKSINLTYDRFWLPPGATFHIYNKDTSQILGAFTENNNKGTAEKPRGFATGLVIGDLITLEYYEPKEVPNPGIISINKVIHGYRYIGPIRSFLKADDTNFEGSGACNVNINCPEGADWQDEKQSVALMVFAETFCTGSLINKTSQDSSLYFLTACHCVDGSLHPDNEITQYILFDANLNGVPNQLNDLMFYWNYESSNCSNEFDFTSPSTVGATLVANAKEYDENENDYGIDFALLRLYENPLNAGANPYLNGWDISDTPTNGAVSIHHPHGDIKKISVDTNEIVSSIAPDGIEELHSELCWQVTWDIGVTEPGSSGSPLYNMDGRVIGQLTGGFSECNGTYNNGESSYYGKLNAAWNYGNTRFRQLEHWLDSIGSITVLDGTFLCKDELVQGHFTSDETFNAGCCNENVFWGIIENNSIITIFAANDSVQWCGNVSLEHVTIQENSQLIINAANNVTIVSDFEVKLGSTLEIN
jgi:lysyl endopeptidase